MTTIEAAASLAEALGDRRILLVMTTYGNWCTLIPSAWRQNATTYYNSVRRRVTATAARQKVDAMQAS
jgi:hypothetical protein